MHLMPKKYPTDQRDWALRMWIVQAQVDDGDRAGPSSEELAEIKALESQVRDLTEADETRKTASIFVAGELDPPPHRSSVSSTSSEPLVVGESRSGPSSPSWACRSPQAPT